MKKYFIIIVGLLPASFSMQAQQVPAGMEVTEIFNVAEAFRQAPHLSFDMQFQYADSAHASVILEQLSGSYKLQNGKFHGRIDSTEFVQGNVYYLTIFREDSIISVGNRQVYNDLLRMPLLDSIFRNVHIQSMTVSKADDSTRSLKIIFKPGTGYSMYELRYDLNNYRIRKIQYTSPGTVSVDNPTGMTSLVSILFSNYNTSVIDESNFSEDNFIYKKDGQFFVRPAYSGFRILANTSN